MALFRRKSKPTAGQVKITGPLTSVVTQSTTLDGGQSLFTAREVAELVRAEVQSWSADARIYLILSNEVRRDGRAGDWEFHALFPALAAEGIWQLKGGSDDRNALLVSRMSPVPEPGTTEYLMAAVSPQIARDQQLAWENRLSLISALPSDFTDSAAAAAAIERLQPQLFASGPVRMKGRRLPSGSPVWETKGVDLIHVPFVSSDETTASFVLRESFDH